MPRETKKYFEEPEFEKNCNAFVNEVNTLIKQSYPHIGIDALNETMYTFYDPTISETHKEILKHTDNPEKNLKTYERLIRSKDVDSANCNFAEVDIWIRKNHDSKEVIEETIQALGNILNASKKYSGELLTELTDLISDSDKDMDKDDMSLSELEEIGDAFRAISGEVEDNPSFNRYGDGRIMNAHLFFVFKDADKTKEITVDALLEVLAKKQK